MLACNKHEQGGHGYMSNLLDFGRLQIVVSLDKLSGLHLKTYI